MKIQQAQQECFTAFGECQYEEVELTVGGIDVGPARICKKCGHMPTLPATPGWKELFNRERSRGNSERVN